MNGWKIQSWSKELGVGTLSCGAAPLEFTAAVAEVNDLEPGEDVEVRLVPDGESWTVRSVVPVRPRFRPPPTVVPGSAEPLHETRATAVSATLAEAKFLMDGRIALLDDMRLRLEFDNDGFSYGAWSFLEVASPEYVELPTRFGFFSCALSSNLERDYLATRVHLPSDSVALTLVGDSRRFFFVIGSDVTCGICERGAPRQQP